MLPQVTFRGLSPSTEIMHLVCRKANKLGEMVPLLRGCHVVIEASPRGSQRPLHYRVSLQLSGGIDAQTRAPRHATHASLAVALGEVFRTARRGFFPRGHHPRGDGAALGSRAH
jgi:hypothetical protein